MADALNAPLWLGDWAGALLWIGARAEDAPRIRALAAEAGGHAMLLRAPAARRAELGLLRAPAAGAGGSDGRGQGGLRSAWPVQSGPALEIWRGCGQNR